MGKWVDKTAVAEYLVHLKHLVSTGAWTWLSRTKSMLTLSEFEWTATRDMKRILLEMTPEDYFDGPDPDDKKRFTGEIWKFAPRVSVDNGTVTLYVKVTIQNHGGDRLLVISFHRAREGEPIRYPYRK